jgi:hypothetical protein
LKHRRVHLLPALAAALLLAACAGFLSRGEAPLLRIAPNSLGARTLEQRLTISWPAAGAAAPTREQRSLEAVLDIADGKLRLILLAAGLRLMSLEYNGDHLTETRHASVPLAGARMMNDLLLIVTPLEALRPALPPDWRIEESRQADGACRREIRQGGAEETVVVVIDYAAGCQAWSGRVEFEQRRLGYHLSLESYEL